MIYAIRDAVGSVVNTIVATPDFVDEYCQQNGYTFTKVEEDVSTPAPPTELEQELGVWEELDTAYQEGVNSAYDGERTSAQS